MLNARRLRSLRRSVSKATWVHLHGRGNESDVALDSFRFTALNRLRQRRDVRAFLLSLSLGTCLASAQAQEQERKLADRLLRPDMSLANPAQDKKFHTAGSTPVDRKLVAKSFYSGDEKVTRSFSSSKAFSSKEFSTGEFSRTDAAAAVRTNAESAYSKTRFRTKESVLVRSSAEEGKVASVRAYPDSRSFLAQGTRQKILSRENKPLTIDEVRELLNTSR